LKEFFHLTDEQTPLMIQVKSKDCRTANRRLADYPMAIPSEMFVPKVLTGIEQRHDHVWIRIKCLSAIRFM
jgi:hypothetical protein